MLEPRPRRGLRRPTGGPPLSTPTPATPEVAADFSPGRPRPAAPEPTGNALLDAVLLSLDDDKAEDVVAIDLRGRSEMGDFMVIASGRSTRQVASISDKLAERLKREHGVISKVEGKEASDWVLIDAGDVIVHVFRPEVREFYQLEKMWLPSGMPAGAPRQGASQA